MGRNRVYSTPAERQRAYRQRAIPSVGIAPPAVIPKKSRPLSRPKRLAEVEKQVRLLIEEYEAWLDSMPDSLRDSQPAELLAEAIEQLTTAADIIAETTLPLGFGRD